MPYDISKFRLVKHGVDETSAHCRQCTFNGFGENGKDVTARARQHAKKTLHTVDVYRTHHIEYTSYTKEE